MKKVVFFLLVSFLSLTVVSSAFAESRALYNFVKFNSANNNRFEVEYNADGSIKGIAAKDPADFCKGATKAQFDAVKIANDFIINNGSMFNVNNAYDMKVESIDRTEAATHVYFAHYFKGKRVMDSEMSVHINNAGQVIMVNNSVVALQEKVALTRGGDAANLVSGDRAVEISKKHVNLVAERDNVKLSEVVVGKDGKPVNAYKVEIPAKEPLGDFVCIVSAVDGTVLDSMDIMNHASKPAKPSTVKPAEKAVKGSIYMTNPLKCKESNEPLVNLTGGKGLSGKWAKAINEDADPAEPNADGNYIYKPEDTHFDEVNAYYHVNKIHDFFKSFGFNGLDRAMQITVHYGDAYDNAFFSPMSGSIALGDGSRLNDLAKEESVIYHEYTHACTNAIVSMPYREESGAMNEGFSDYFACTITEDPEVGEWAMAKMNKPYIRTLVNKAHYPEDIQHEVHYDSNIYGGALWDLRKELGAKTTDKLVHFSRSYLKGTSSPKFTDGLNALMSADKECFRGINSEKIKAVFAARGIKPAATTATTAANMKQTLKYEAMNGDAEAEKLLMKAENEFPATEENNQ